MSDQAAPTTTYTIVTHTPEPVTIDLEVTRNTKGYNWTVKVNTVQDVEVGMKLLQDTCEKMRVVYGGDPAGGKAEEVTV